jgi:oxygen-independent coproporphyrinogen-3 oxidase
VLDLSLTTQNSSEQAMRDGLSLYIHIPFCQTRCSYCDFNTYTNLSHLYGRYTRALRTEIEATLVAVQQGTYNPLVPLAPLPDTLVAETAKVPLNTIFLGGGTPSLLPTAELAKIFKAIQNWAIISSQTEVTLEANPGTLSLEKLEALRSLGINRLSFGVQAFDDAMLRGLGRTHDSAGAVRAVELARQAGFDNLNLDFIYGLPGQDLATWRKTLEQALALRPEHFSLYALTLETNTSMGRAVESGKLSLPEEDLAADMYLLALDMLGQAGYIQYEISNWARDDVSQHACRHNLVYWHTQPYIGFGPGAHSFFNNWRYAVLRDPQEYITKLRQGASVIVTDEAEQMEQGLQLADTVILALRLNEGLDLDQVEREFGRSLHELFPGVVARFLEYGLLEQFVGSHGEARLRLTVRGRLLSNEVFIRFLPE